MSFLSRFPDGRTSDCERVLRKYGAFAGAFAVGTRTVARLTAGDADLADRVATIPVYAGISGFAHDEVVDRGARADDRLSQETRNQLVTIGDRSQQLLFETVLNLRREYGYEPRATLTALERVSLVQFDESRTADADDPVPTERARVHEEATAWATMLAAPAADVASRAALPPVARYHRLLVHLLRVQIMSDARSDVAEDLANGVETLPLALLEVADGVALTEETPATVAETFAGSEADRILEELTAEAVDTTVDLAEELLSRRGPVSERALEAWNESVAWFLRSFPGCEERRLSGREATAMLSAYADSEGIDASFDPAAVFRRPADVTIRLPRKILQFKRIRARTSGAE